MMSTMVERWVANVTCGKQYKGEPHSSNKRTWFRGNLLFYYAEPVGRLEPTLSGGWIILQSSRVIHIDADIPIIDVESIGVDRNAHGDVVTVVGMLTGDALHQHVRESFVERFDEMVNRSRNLAIDLLSNPTWVEGLRKGASNVDKQWSLYRAKMAPRLARLPSVAAAVEAEIERRLTEYNDPKAVEKRLRKKARRIAIKALGINTRGFLAA